MNRLELCPSEIAFWLGSRRLIPSLEEIMEHTGCARATAYRWRAFAKSNGRRQQLPYERPAPPAEASP